MVFTPRLKYKYTCFFLQVTDLCLDKQNENKILVWGKKLCAFKATEWQVLKHCLYTHAKLVPLDRKGKYGVYFYTAKAKVDTYAY